MTKVYFYPFEVCKVGGVALLKTGCDPLWLHHVNAVCANCRKLYPSVCKCPETEEENRNRCYESLKKTYPNVILEYEDYKTAMQEPGFSVSSWRENYTNKLKETEG